jgi:hypothetical protein
VFQGITRDELLHRFKVGGKVLDLLGQHRAHSKHAPHAERLAEVPGGGCFASHWISTKERHPSDGSLTAMP